MMVDDDGGGGGDGDGDLDTHSDPRSNNVAKGIPALLISAKAQVYDGPGISACRRYEHRYSGPASQRHVRLHVLA